MTDKERKHLDWLMGKIKRDREQIENLKENIEIDLSAAADLCPFKIGNKVISDYGYSYEDRKIQVYKILFNPIES